MRIHACILLWLLAKILPAMTNQLETKNGDVRLANGSATDGRVELYNNGQWGTVCDDNWDMNDAKVVCRQLGFRYAISAHGDALFGEGEGPIHISNLNCLGTESSLIECYFSLTDNCEHEEDASVTCLPFEEGFVRLKDGNGTDGRVEIFFKGEWGTICDDTWDTREATVVCRQLGFQGALSAPRKAAFGEGEGPIHLDTLDCMGTESSLLDCEYKQKANCMHYEDAGVECFNSSGILSLEDGSIRLVGGHDLAGRVEIYLDNQWGTVCDDDWDVLDATVVCRHLGFRDAVSAPRRAVFGEGVGPIHLDAVKCSGDEASLLDCEYKREADCTHNEDAGVTCRDFRHAAAAWIIVVLLVLSLSVMIVVARFKGVFNANNMNLLLRRIWKVSEDASSTNSIPSSSQGQTAIPELESSSDLTIENVESGENKVFEDSKMKEKSNTKTDSVLYTTIPAELTLPAESRQESYEQMTNDNERYEQCIKVEEEELSDEIY